MNTRPSSTVRASQGGGGGRGFIIAVVIVAVLAIVVGGILLSGGDDEEAEPTPVEQDDSSTSADGADDGADSTESSVPQFGEVVVDGDPLNRYEPSLEDPAIGQVAPKLTGNDFKGNETVIGGTADRPTMVMFLAHWCPHCNAEIDRLVSYLADNGAPAGIRIALVTTGSDSTAPNWPPSQWLIDKGVSGFDVLADSQVQTAGAAWGLSSYPYIVMLDADGTVLSRMSGEQPEGFFADAFADLATLG